MPIDTSKTGAAIATHRQRMNMSQQGLAGLMNVTHQAVSKWETGLALPDTETLLALAKLFGTTMEDLLMGRLPAEPEQAEEPAPEQDEAEETVQNDPEPVQASDLGDLDFASVMNMLPFVSTKAADRLFRVYTQSSQPDASALISIAPFVSTGALSEYISNHPLKHSSPEVVASLAPFLPSGTVDQMILGMDGPLPPHVMQTLMPFASTGVVDQMVMGKLGISAEDAPSGQPDLSRQIQDEVHQKIRQKLDALDEKISSHPLSANAKRASSPADKRESPRTRLIRKAIETNNYDIIESCFDELDAEAYRLLLHELANTGDAKLLDLLCESAGELEPNEQFELVQLLIKGKMYGELAEVIEELDEDVQHELLDRAFESNDPELLHIISEHL